MITARITQAVMAPRWGTSGIAAAAFGASAMAAEAQAVEEIGHEDGNAAGVIRVDLHRRAHADAKRRLAGKVVELNDHRNALDDLDPVAGGVLRREKREARAGGRADR